MLTIVYYLIIVTHVYSGEVVSQLGPFKSERACHAVENAMQHNISIDVAFCVPNNYGDEIGH